MSYPTEHNIEEQFRAENPEMYSLLEKADTNDKKKAIAKKIVKLIVADLSDRSGLSDMWENIDTDTQKEIRNEWQEIVEKNIINLIHIIKLQYRRYTNAKTF